MAGRNIHPFEAEIIELGWIFHKECHCSGIYSLEYRKGSDRLKVYPNRKNFRTKAGIQGLISDIKTLLSQQ